MKHPGTEYRRLSAMCVVEIRFRIKHEQEVTETLRDYSCLGWNDGQRESWTCPACDAHFHFGGDLRRDRWGWRRDKFGVAFVTYGLSANHMRGFVLDDRKLSYGPEQVMETCYNFPVPLRPGVFAALDLQYLNNPRMTVPEVLSSFPAFGCTLSCEKNATARKPLVRNP